MSESNMQKKVWQCKSCGKYFEPNYEKRDFSCPNCAGNATSPTNKTWQDISEEGLLEDRARFHETIINFFELSDEDLKQGILKSLKDLEMQEAGTGWGKLSLILSGTTAKVMMTKLLKAIIDQNKIIIRQNELILRSIKEKTE